MVEETEKEDGRMRERKEEGRMGEIKKGGK